jgi:tetratricopeptide (TPR) repeat protein
MLETIREFALERLADGGEEEEIRERQLRYLTQLAHSAKLHTEDTGPMRHDLVNPERDNIRVALEWAVTTGRQQEGLALAIALENNWVTTDPEEGARWLHALLELGTPSEEQLMMALRCLGNSATVRGEDEGIKRYEQSLAIARKLGAPDQIASLLHRVAVWRLHEGRKEEGLALLEEAEAYNLVANLERVTASIVLLRGDIERKAGNLEGALPHYGESLAAARRSGFSWWEKNVLFIMAYTLYELGRIEQGSDCALEGLRVAADMGDRPGLADGLAFVARGYAARGDCASAGRIVGAIEGEAARTPIPGWDPEDALVMKPLEAFDDPEFAAGRERGRREAFGDVLDEILHSVD